MSKIKYHTAVLDNGLKVIVHEDRSIPKMVMDIIYRVGAKDEDAERTGFAHLFEHLMFGGSEHIPEYDSALQKVGGDNNAFTTNDVTNYYLSLPSNQLETGFWLESDRMLALDFSQEKLDIQKSVVIEEFKQRYLNKPYGDAHNLLREIHFTDHPYRWPTIGKKIAHIEGATLDDVKEFFYGFYAPNNATMVVAGDVDFDQVMNLAEKWFGEIPERKLSKQEIPQEPVQKEPRAGTVHRNVPFPGVYKMYHIPAKTDQRYYAAEILTDILSGGKAALLYQHMVKEKQVATSIRAFSWGAHHPGMISIDGTLSKGVSVNDYEAELEIVLKKLQVVENSELSRVKNSIESQYILERGPILNRAMNLALCDALGDSELINTSLDFYLDLSLEEVRDAAVNYLDPNNCSTLYYLTENGEGSN